MGKRKLKNAETKKDKFYNHVEITAALIVKNEIDNIKRCLDSISWVDQIVVVDTGSTDGTAEFIKENYPNVQLHFDAWDGNFSRSRNVSLSFVKTNWLLIIDADEEWVFEQGANADGLKAQLVQLPVNKVGGVKCQLEDMVQGQIAATFKPIRLFNAKAHLKYRSTVHNEPIFKGQVAVCGGIKLLHYGYDVPAEKAKMKVERTAGLLLKRYEDNPEDHEAVFYLTNIYSAYHTYADYDKTLEWAEVYFKLMEGDHIPAKKVRRNIFYSAAETARRIGKLDVAERWVLAGKQRYGKDLDLNYTLMLIGINLEKPEYIIEGATTYINKYQSMEADPLVQSAGFVFTKKPANLMNCFHKLGIIRVQEGLNHIRVMDNLLDGMPPGKAKMETLKGLAKELKVIGAGEFINQLNSVKIIK